MSVAYPELPQSNSLVHVGRTSAQPAPLGQEAVKKSDNSRLNESPYEQFYRTYCTELKRADAERENYKKQHPEWKDVFDDEFPHPKKGLLAMSTGDPNGHVRVRRLREFARFIVEDVKNEDDRNYITQGEYATMIF
jgi:hypothetical protein